MREFVSALVVAAMEVFGDVGEVNHNKASGREGTSEEQRTLYLYGWEKVVQQMKNTRCPLPEQGVPRPI